VYGLVSLLQTKASSLLINLGVVEGKLDCCRFKNGVRTVGTDYAETAKFT